MVHPILQTTQATGEFLIGAVFDFLDIAATGIAATPGQIYDSTKYAVGADHYMGEGRPWSKMGTGYSGDFVDGDNGFTRVTERFNNAAFSFGLGGLNTVLMGGPYRVVNQWMGIDCPYFFPGPTTAREAGRFFSSGLAMMLLGQRFFAAPELPRPFYLEASKAIEQGPVRVHYAIPSGVEDLADHIRRGSVVAPSFLRRTLDVRNPGVLKSAAHSTVELVREGYLPVRLLEGIIWDTHPRTAFLYRSLSTMRYGSPRLIAMWKLLQLDTYEVETLANGDTQLRPIIPPTQCPVPAVRPASAVTTRVPAVSTYN